MGSGSEAGSYLRFIDLGITQLYVHRLVSNKEEEETVSGVWRWRDPSSSLLLSSLGLSDTKVYEP